jgi:hypothetical protein
MILNGMWAVFGSGMLGPVLMELVKVGAWQDPAKVSDHYRRPTYWIATAALFLVGGIVAVLNGTDHVPIMRAVQLGIAAPGIIVGFLTATPSRKAGFLGSSKLLSWA